MPIPYTHMKAQNATYTHMTAPQLGPARPPNRIPSAGHGYLPASSDALIAITAEDIIEITRQFGIHPNTPIERLASSIIGNLRNTNEERRALEFLGRMFVHKLGTFS